MGSFDTVWFKRKDGSDGELQFKSGESLQLNFEVGDTIELPDGMHFDFDSVFVVYKKKIVAAFHKTDGVVWNKWGGQMPFPDVGDSPVVQIAKAIKASEDKNDP